MQTNQCHDLLDNGVDGLHFFTLNHSDQVSEILDNILFLEEIMDNLNKYVEHTLLKQDAKRRFN